MKARRSISFARSERMAEATSAWRAYGQALKQALWANVCVVEDDPVHRCGWMDGGCFIAARAVVHLTGGSYWGVHAAWTSRETLVQVEHVIVRTPGGEGFLDGDGFSTERTMIARWRKQLSVRAERPTVTLAPVSPVDLLDGVLTIAGEEPAGVQCDLVLAARLEQRLRSTLPLPPPPPQRHENSLAEVGAAALAIGALLPFVPPPGPTDLLDPFILGAVGASRLPKRAKKARR